MRSFLSAISFLTILPIPKKFSSEFKHSTLFFPFVGLLIGFILIITNFIFSRFLPKTINCIFILNILIIITGAIHLDGFADTIEAIYAGKDKEEIIRIMDDPHIGMIGAVSISLLLLTKFFLIFNLPEKYILQALIFFPTLSRMAMTLSITISKPLKNDGLGKMFVENTKFSDFLFAGFFPYLFPFFFSKQRD